MCESLKYRISSKDLKVRVTHYIFFNVTFVWYSFISMYIVVLNLESVDEILWCYHSYKTSLGALSIATICFKYLTELNLAFFWGTLSDPKVLPYGIITCLKFYLRSYILYMKANQIPGHPLFSKMKE